MVVKIWRLSHMVLAALSAVFLLVIALSGAILGLSSAKEQILSDRGAIDLNQVMLNKSSSILKEAYPELVRLEILSGKQVQIEILNDEGESEQMIVDPISGKKLGVPQPKSRFISQVTTIHRSLFLHEVGRFIVGITSFLFLLILLSGAILIVARQGGMKHFFSQVDKSSSAGYWHTWLGRLLLIPLLVSALTGTYLFMSRFGMLPQSTPHIEELSLENGLEEEAETIPIVDIPIFSRHSLSEVKQVDFPLYDDDPEEVFVLTLKDRILTVNQFTGEVVRQEFFPLQTIWGKIALDWHTGQNNYIWAIVLALSSLLIVVFIYTGTVMIINRRHAKKKSPKGDVSQAEYVILYGSQGGTTAYYASKVAEQIKKNGISEKVFVGSMDSYQFFPKATQMLLFTSTYGDGEAPDNARNFEELLKKYPQNGSVKCSVVGFGSKKFPKYCSFAYQVHHLLEEQKWADLVLLIHTVDRKSFLDFSEWLHSWSSTCQITISLEEKDYKKSKK